MATQTPTMSLEKEGIKIAGPMSAAGEAILPPQALRFVAKLQRRFGPVRAALLHKRVERQARLDAGEMPDFLLATKDIRAAEWKVASIPKDLQDRRVEITGPVDRKMIINALNSG